MLKRIITAVVALVLLVPILWFSDTVVFPIAISLLCTVACYEMLKCMGQLKHAALSVPVILFGAGMPIVARYAHEYIVPLILLLFCYITVCSVIGYRKADVTKIGIAFYEIFSIIVGFTLLVRVRDLRPYEYLIIFVAAWMTDTFAYFTGCFLGKHKLCPEISPKKTVEGAIGGVVGAVVGSVILAFIINGCGVGVHFNVLEAALTAIPLSFIGQIGDLSASLAKRHFGVKDYGNIFPGHGGVLDRFDSIIPIAVMVYIITIIINTVSA